MSYKKIPTTAIPGNPFAMVGDNWMLLTAGNEPHINTMVAWGSFGVMWGRDIATVYVRHQRYTMEFMEESAYFTLSFYEPRYRKQLMICGSVSARDTDKIASCRLTPAYTEQGAPFFKEANLVIVCKKLYYQDFDMNNIVDHSVDKHYSALSNHRMYIGEIVEVLERI